MERTALYRTVWRWHFYAGLLVIPLVLILSVTGAAYLFKPQIDRWEERDFRGLGVEGAVSPAAQVAAASAGGAETTVTAVGGGIFRVGLWVPGRQDAIDTPFTVAAF